MRLTALDLEFVDSAPDEMAESVLYISMQFRTTMHLCACGCGNQVVMPLRPDRWSMLFDGETATMTPSVGNGGFPCRSHYWIRRNQVAWLPPIGTPHTGAAPPHTQPSPRRAGLVARALHAIRRWLERSI